MTERIELEPKTFEALKQHFRSDYNDYAKEKYRFADQESFIDAVGNKGEYDRNGDYKEICS
ncbi:hypothetical protein [Eupransor demetentiae]|uniref:Uncharacterized protein n=1 Tax=Eupransor demetentiae TaxID=3109584 RepID=A0ABM9N4N8_9LACO|nr:hypothetical protein R54876_GBNLAHCA_00701 [Lactobacillaceae bacterium LMG 33000]